LLACAFAACGDGGDDPGVPGTLIVEYVLGNDLKCDDVGVKRVRAELNDMQFVEDAPCSAGQVRFLNIPAGTYKIRMYGEDDKGVDIMDNYSVAGMSIQVSGGDMHSVPRPIRLYAAPAHLFVRWDMGFTSCKGVGVVSFEISAWRGEGQLLVEQTLDCLLEGDGPDQYREIADPERRFTGSESGEVFVQPLDKEAANFGAPAVFRFNKPGAGQNVKITVDCGTTGYCGGTGKPDPN
jgi:hypothetical protein